MQKLYPYILQCFFIIDRQCFSTLDSSEYFVQQKNQHLQRFTHCGDALSSILSHFIRKAIFENTKF